MTTEDAIKQAEDYLAQQRSNQSDGSSFDFSTAKPVEGGFDFATAKPVSSTEFLPFAGTSVGAVGQSGGAYLGNTVKALLHPIQTAKGLGNIAAGTVEKAIPGQQPQEIYADTAGEFIKQRYGSFDALRETWKRDPVGVLADASMFLTGGGGVVAKIGDISGIPKLVSVGRLATKAASLTDPLAITMQSARFAGRIPARVLESSLKGSAGQAINALIKPTNRQFSYGRNPGLAVSQEGIVASSMEDLAAKASAKTDEFGQKIGVVLNDPNIAINQLNISDSLDPIHIAIKKARQNPRTNSKVIQRLENLRDDILGTVVNPDGTTTATRNLTSVSPFEAFSLKKTIGDLTKWTDDFSDDSIVNGALKQVYGKVRSAIEQVAPGIRPLNERYANLLEASNAAKRQAFVMQRNNPFAIKLTDILFGAEGGRLGGLGGATIGILLSRGAKAAMDSPYIRTQIANWMAHATPTEIEAFFNRIPGLRSEATRVGLLVGTGQQRISAFQTSRQDQ